MPRRRGRVKLVRMVSPLRKPLGVLCFVLVVGGVSGLLHECFGLIRFFDFVRFLVQDGYKVYGHACMVVPGLALGAAAGSSRRG